MTFINFMLDAQGVECELAQIAAWLQEDLAWCVRRVIVRRSYTKMVCLYKNHEWELRVNVEATDPLTFRLLSVPYEEQRQPPDHIGVQRMLEQDIYTKLELRGFTVRVPDESSM